MIQILAKEFNFDQDYAKAILIQNFPQLKNKEKCPNCGASMKKYVFTFDVLDALLLQAMAQKVQNNLSKGMGFHEANMVRIHDLQGTYASKSRTTQMRILGLIQKVKHNGKHVPGTWLITRRGWNALKGDPVPKYAGSFRNEKMAELPPEYADVTTTIKEAFADNKKAEYQSAIDDYDPHVWYDVVALQEGNLL